MWVQLISTGGTLNFRRLDTFTKVQVTQAGGSDPWYVSGIDGTTVVNLHTPYDSQSEAEAALLKLMRQLGAVEEI